MLAPKMFAPKMSAPKTLAPLVDDLRRFDAAVAAHRPLDGDHAPPVDLFGHHGEGLLQQLLLERRAAGAAVLMVSEDLDELMEMSDRIMVMSDGKLVYDTPAREADIAVIGAHMAGHH